MIGDGVKFFDEPTAYFASGNYLNMAMTQFADSHPEAEFAVFVRKGGFFVRVIDDILNFQFMNYLSHAFKGAVTMHKADPFS